MGYYIDLESISIDQYKEILKHTQLIPSWKILEENIDKNLEILKKYDIKNLNQLLIELKDKQKIDEFSQKSGLEEKYLEVLRRVVNGYKQKPNRLKDFSCISIDTITKLEKLGIKNTLHFYDRVLSLKKIKELSQEIKVDYEELIKLSKLSDLSRIRWVNHTFAYVLLESAYDTTKKVIDADYKKLYLAIKKLNEEKKIYKAHIGENDMKMLIESAQLLDCEIEY